MDCSPPGSSAHGILQAKILEWVSAPFSRGPSRPRDPNQVSCMGRRIPHHRGTWEAQETIDIRMLDVVLSLNESLPDLLSGISVSGEEGLDWALRR